jgi:energy-coupling factor transport system ATP-binding protein
MLYWTVMIELTKVTFTYPGAHRPALREVSLALPSGELVLVCGPSGSGKSTLLRCLNGLVPHFSGGILSGSISIDGLDPVQSGPQVMSQHVGFVFQDPEAQFVVDRVEDEIAFALENMAQPVAEMQARIAAVLNLLELQPMRARRIETLSGGEKQRVAIAASLALRPHILALDEPTSQLDPGSADEVLTALVRLNEELGLTILVVEHRLERVLPYIHRIIYLDNVQPGAICDSPRQVMGQIDLNPPVVALGKAYGWEPLPLTVEEARRFVVQIPKPVRFQKPDRFKPRLNIQQRQPFIQAQGLEVSYGPMLALHDLYLEVWPGEIAVLMGPNGAGKTTLLRCLVGLIHPQRGRVIVAGEDIVLKRLLRLPASELPATRSQCAAICRYGRAGLEITLRNQARSKKTGQAQLTGKPTQRLASLILLSPGSGDKRRHIRVT